MGKSLSRNPDRTLEPIYTRLLEHSNFIIRIYGMRGIGASGLTGHAEALKTIARRNPPGLVRRTAIAALAEMGIAYDPESEDAQAEDASESVPADREAPQALPTPVPEESEPLGGE